MFVHVLQVERKVRPLDKGRWTETDVVHFYTTDLDTVGKILVL